MPSPLDAFYLQLLVANRNSDGGWGYHPQSPSAVEPTAWALMVLVAWKESDAAAQACAQGVAWLLKTQRADGAWPAFPGQPEGCWVTSVAAHALEVQGGQADAVKRALKWLVNAWPAEGGLLWKLRRLMRPPTAVQQDHKLLGWNWTARTASWVEPTAHALLFLRRVPPAMLSPRALERRQLAERMLYNRMCPGGGWNSGNPLVYGVAGIPRVGPTAWALLALQHEPERAEVTASLDWLGRAYAEIQGPASLALAHRCLAAYGRPAPPLAPALARLYTQNDFFQNLLTVAWAAWGLH